MKDSQSNPNVLDFSQVGAGDVALVGASVRALANSFAS